MMYNPAFKAIAFRQLEPAPAALFEGRRDKELDAWGDPYIDAFATRNRLQLLLVYWYSSGHAEMIVIDDID